VIGPSDRPAEDPALLERVLGIAAGRGPRAGATAVVAVDGPSGSGKTTLGRALVAAHRASGGAGRSATAGLLSMDALYPGWDGLAAATALLAERVLLPLRRGDPATHPRWDWAAGDWARDPDGAPVLVQLPAVDLLVVEGCGSGARAGARALSALVFLDGPAALRRERALARDGEAYRPHWERWAAQERALFAAEDTARRADVRVTAG
jgi:uridine kinase